MGFANLRDTGKTFVAKYSLKTARSVAGGAGDATDQNGAAVDRDGYMSCKMVVAINAVITATKNVVTTARLQDSADGVTGWANYGTGPANNTIVNGSDMSGLMQQDYDLSGARRYIRVVTNSDLSNTATDTADVTGLIILTGSRAVPAL